mmetsp:Transcript_35134/g.77323  ORF Transcript_35134/g.77323 Transcript_35134/m.77323 type:complete len:205 (+) Transcript_35134:434-1048(+)
MCGAAAYRASPVAIHERRPGMTARRAQHRRQPRHAAHAQTRRAPVRSARPHSDNVDQVLLEVDQVRLLRLRRRRLRGAHVLVRHARARKPLVISRVTVGLRQTARGLVEVVLLGEGHLLGAVLEFARRRDERNRRGRVVANVGEVGLVRVARVRRGRVGAVRREQPLRAVARLVTAKLDQQLLGLVGEFALALLRTGVGRRAAA